MSPRRPTRVLAALFATLALGVLLPPYVNVNRWRPRIAGALAGALGRDVTVGSVALRLLPQPGFTLSHFAIADDASFSAEPVVRADEVTAALRLSSLWRGRLEIAKLSLKEPSLNLVRRADGHWNVESLLLKASQTPTAPTTKTRPEARPRFPYIEVDSGRINFKSGAEKMVWALADADFAIWLEAEDEWHARLLARPVRSDANLGGDAGLVRLQGSFQRASRLGAMPLRLQLQLQDAQLGQLSTLIFGRDRGWRGLSNAAVQLAGTPAQLALVADARVEQFRRYDLTPADSLTLRVHCVAQWSAAAERLGGLDCESPVGDGELSARGSLTFFQPGASPVAQQGPAVQQRGDAAEVRPRLGVDLSLVARDVPLDYALKLLRRAKRDLAEDLTSDGLIDTAISARSNSDGELVWAGGGATRAVRLRSRLLEQPLAIGIVQFSVEDRQPPAAAPAVSRARFRRGHGRAPASYARQTSTAQTIAEDSGFHVAVRPFALDLGSAQPASVAATFNRLGYELRLAGGAELPRVLRVARLLGVPATATDAGGSAHGALLIAGPWAGFQRPLVTGTAELHQVTVALNGIRGAVTIRNASLQLTPESVEAQKLDVILGNGAIALTGWVRRPRGCALPATCRYEFGLRSPVLALDDVNRILNPRVGEQPWYRRLAAGDAGGDVGTRLLQHLEASGHLTVGTLLVKTIAAQNVEATVQLAPGELRVTGLTADLFAGKLSGDWRAEFSGDGSPARYSGQGTVERVAMGQVSSAMHDAWATGTLQGSYRFATSGLTASELAANASGSLDFRWRDGVLLHLRLGTANQRTANLRTSNLRTSGRASELPSSGLAIRDFQGRVLLRAGVFSFAQSKLQTPGGIYWVSGAASPRRELSFTLAPAAGSRARPATAYSLSGTLAAPRVLPATSVAPESGMASVAAPARAAVAR